MDPKTVHDYCIVCFYDENKELQACEKRSPSLDGYCEDHYDLKITKDFDEILELEQRYVSKKVYEFLQQFESLSGKKRRGTKVIELFDFLLKHKHFIFLNTVFAETIRIKLEQFIKEGNGDLVQAKYYLHQLFPLYYPPEKLDQDEDEKKIKKSIENDIFMVSI